VEVNVWDRLALGAAGGVGLSGPGGGGYARLRPIVWGGGHEQVLSAITIETAYAYMMYGGGDPFADVHILPCMADDGCPLPPHYVSVPAHVGAVTIGLEHSLPKGFTFRYGLGWGHLLATPKWRCELNGSPYNCTASAGNPPARDFLVLNFGFSHSLPSW
jgi:hypothetical protein